MSTSKERAIALVEESKKRQLEKLFETLDPLEFRTLFRDLSPEGIRKVLRVVADERSKDVLEKMGPLFNLVELMPQLLVLHSKEEKLRLYVFDEEKKKYKRRASAKENGKAFLISIPGSRDFYTFANGKMSKWSIRTGQKLSLESRVVKEFRSFWACIAASDGTLFVSGPSSFTKVSPNGSTLIREVERVRKLFLYGENGSLRVVGVVGGEYGSDKEELLFFEASELKLLFKVGQIFQETQKLSATTFLSFQPEGRSGKWVIWTPSEETPHFRVLQILNSFFYTPFALAPNLIGECRTDTKEKTWISLLETKGDAEGLRKNPEESEERKFSNKQTLLGHCPLTPLTDNMFFDSFDLTKKGEFGFRAFQFIDISEGKIIALPPTLQAKKDLTNRLLPLFPGSFAKDTFEVIVGFIPPLITS